MAPSLSVLLGFCDRVSIFVGVDLMVGVGVVALLVGTSTLLVVVVTLVVGASTLLVGAAGLLVGASTLLPGGSGLFVAPLPGISLVALNSWVWGFCGVAGW